ncbi:S1C family serine protease [Kribbella sp. NPDC004875]|uniref:S1C family serine protease n=1 Tax=Kribbella sp. NPDC004875 TaxID=3364107 RepID=UPI003674FE04
MNETAGPGPQNGNQSPDGGQPTNGTPQHNPTQPHQPQAQQPQAQQPQQPQAQQQPAQQPQQPQAQQPQAQTPRGQQMPQAPQSAQWQGQPAQPQQPQAQTPRGQQMPQAPQSAQWQRQPAQPQSQPQQAAQQSAQPQPEQAAQQPAQPQPQPQQAAQWQGQSPQAQGMPGQAGYQYQQAGAYQQAPYQHAQYQQGQHAPYPPFGQMPFPYPPQRPPKKRGRRLLGAGVLGLAAALVAGSVAWGINQHSAGNTSELSQKAFDAASVASKVSPGLVDVNTVLGYQGARAAGTGIVLTSDGEVLTNHHVIQGATSITVTDIGNGKTYKASVVGYDDQHDIAVLKLKDASGLQTADTGNSDQVKVGDQVVGVGNAGGVGGTPSYAAGKVTALNQAITATDENGQDPENLTNLIGTDADIQAGDSGGPLVNAGGKVIGVDVAGNGGNHGGQGGPGQTAATTGNTVTATLAASGSGNGYGDGTGNGDGSGDGTGFPFGDNGPGSWGDGNGSGLGNGNGDGSGFGDGSGQGQGQGNGFGDGQGGSGNGSGTATSGYAIPINQALDIAQQIENGKSSDAVHIGDSAMLGISVVSSDGTTGAVVGDVVANGHADEAGIEAGDVITSFAGHSVESPDSLSALLNKQHPGDKVEVGWTDQSGQTHKATIELITGPVR